MANSACLPPAFFLPSLHYCPGPRGQGQRRKDHRGDCLTPPVPLTFARSVLNSISSEYVNVWSDRREGTGKVHGRGGRAKSVKPGRLPDELTHYFADCLRHPMGCLLTYGCLEARAPFGSTRPTEPVHPSRRVPSWCNHDRRCPHHSRADRPQPSAKDVGVVRAVSHGLPPQM